MTAEAVLPQGLATPATVVFEDRLERNLARMAAFCRESGFSLRPHAKTHKSVEIARRQMAHGAIGIAVATVGEAEVLTAASGSTSPGVEDVFVAYPLWAEDDLVSRLIVLSERARVSVGLDSAESADRLAPLAGRVSVVVEVDCGLRRTGVLPGRVGAVAAAAARSGLDVAGVFTFPGHSYAPGRGAADAAEDEAEAMVTAVEELERAGFEVKVRSGGSTPSARWSHPGALNELRPGVYVFNDAQQVELEVAGFEDVALVVAATVVSHPAPGRIVLDSGSKVLGPDRAPWATGRGRLLGYPEARMTGLWEHHAVVELGTGAGAAAAAGAAAPLEAPPLGTVLAVVPNHVCTAVNLVPELVVLREGAVVDRWPVSARAANR